jgi:hypothetical protein
VAPSFAGGAGGPDATILQRTGPAPAARDDPDDGGYSHGIG